MVWFWFGSCFIALLLHVVFGSDTEVVVLRAVRGMEARLPCGQGRVFLDGPNSYVLWLKNDRDLLYRFPNEESEHRTEQIFSSNCDGDMCRDETALYIKRVSEQDAGVYRCRVHYQASPSVDYVTELRLRDAPGMPRIYDENGDEITKGFVGPFSLGSDLTLTCDVNDDQSDTLVYWVRDGAVVSRATPAQPGVLRATVRVRSLTRADLNAHYECRAHNADVTAPLAKSVRVHMYLPPLSVEIRLNNNPDFEAGQPRVVDCVVIGCVPPPAVTWRLGDTLLRPTLHKELHDGNYTVSSLTVAPSLRDDAHKLECRAHNSHLPEGVFHNAITLNVGYRPTCLTTHEEGIGVATKEAETVTCIVDAQPEPMQVSWTFADTRTLYTSVKKVPGHQHRYTSTLTWLPRESDYGELLCRATNAFGEQRRACAFAVARGGSPRAPECVVMRAYPRAVRVQCKKGWDGGRPQTIHLVLVSSSGVLLHNISSQAGHFHLPDVDEHSNLTAQVYASSSRGRSPVERLHLVTLTPIQAEAVSVDTPASWWPWVCAGVGAGVVAAAVVACTAAVRRRRADHNPDLVPRSDGSFHREPDFTREERVLGTTNITVNQLASCPNPYTSSPVPSCRVLVGCAARAQTEPCASTQASYYV